MGRFSRFIWFLLMIIIGGGAGLYYAWYIRPAEFVDAALYNLRPDYKTDYVLMVAEIYDRDHNRLDALQRLDDILAPSDPSRETVVEAAVENAQNLGYNPVDLQKLYRLQEVVSGERILPTETLAPTPTFSAERATAAASTASALPSPTPIPGDSSVPVADSDPFGTGIQLTTDPNAQPMLNLPTAPGPEYNPVQQDDRSTGSSGSSSSDSVGFSGIPDSFFD